MSWVDLGLVIILAAFAVNGLWQGMLRVLGGLIGFIVGLVAAMALYRPLAVALARVTRVRIALEPLAFAIILLGCWITINLLAFAAQRRSRQEEDNWLDDLGGALLGLGTGLLVLGVLVTGTVALGLPVGRHLRASPIGAWLLRLTRVLDARLF